MKLAQAITKESEKTRDMMLGQKSDERIIRNKLASGCDEGHSESTDVDDPSVRSLPRSKLRKLPEAIKTLGNFRG